MDTTVNKIISGKEFNKKFGDIKLYKFTNKDEKHHGFQYKDGLNLDTKNFTNYGNGLHFTTQYHYHDYINFGENLREIGVPNNAQVYIIDRRTIKADMIILGKKIVWYEDTYHAKHIITNNPKALAYIPRDKLKEELCQIVYKKCFDIPQLIKYLPSTYKTHELCKLAIRKDTSLLHHIPYDKRTEDIYIIAIKQNVSILKSIPYEHITKKMCEIVVEQNINALEYVPSHFKTEELYKIIVQKNWHMIKYISATKRTKKICQIAIQQNKCAYLYVPFKVMLSTFIKKDIKIDNSKYCASHDSKISESHIINGG